MRLTFTDEDVRVIAVSDGNQAIARVEEQPPDIVVADAAMPGKNGCEVASYIKRSPRLAQIPVLLLTGAFEPLDQMKAAEAGCDGVLAKPFEPQTVIGRVKELLGRPKGGTELSKDVVVLEPEEQASEPVQNLALALPPATPAPVSVPPGPMAEYLDQLDAALANLEGARRGANALVGREAVVTLEPSPAAIDVLEGDCWDMALLENIEDSDLPER